jgi:PAS domain S-box-containing protein
LKEQGYSGTSSSQQELNVPHLRSLLAAIVESSEDAILSKDLQGIITSWNQAATRIFGYEPEEILGSSVLRLIPKELQGEEAGILSRLSHGERIEHLETVRVTKAGERVDVSLTISPIRNADGVIIGASKIARDISHRRKIERMLVETEKVLATGRMAAVIAHEINNPLEAVGNLIYLARVSSSASKQVTDYLLLAEREIIRVSKIAHQTLGYFREDVAVVNFLVADLMDEVLAVYQTRLAFSKIEVLREFGPAAPLAMRRGELTQVFANLLINAVDCMPNGGDLSVLVKEQTDHSNRGVRIEIKDQGAGIPPDLFGKIFEPFFTTKQQRGTGIGLWISRQFVEAHRGTISVTSNTAPPEQGTCFRIFLPYLNGLQSEVAPTPRG